jgi:hypothetical protein
MRTDGAVRLVVGDHDLDIEPARNGRCQLVPGRLAKWGTYSTRFDASKEDLYARADPAGIKGAKAWLEALRR